VTHNPIHIGYFVNIEYRTPGLSCLLSTEDFYLNRRQPEYFRAFLTMWDKMQTRMTPLPNSQSLPPKMTLA